LKVAGRDETKPEWLSASSLSWSKWTGVNLLQMRQELDESEKHGQD
jgi:hypothetical protein